ncbi:FecR domain-containing protein [Chitinophaga horti]|uniref:FecR domain-containing protein n=1 Tax=Chitinophaga horti TaxID=2920382 RepID=A0ABY6J8I8_9BACT|nr:FecR family protein [Chitinophaga horti]UYQ95800.1 FecR domain-containing protein [Chitinophaga horti]
MDRASGEQLFRKYAQKDITEAEKAAFYEWLETAQDTSQLGDLVDEYIVSFADTSVVEMNEQAAGSILNAILSSGKKPVRRRRTYLLAAAVAALVATSSGIFWALQLPPAPPKVLAPIADNAPVMSGGAKAVLTLGDGSKVVLDSAAQRQIVSGPVTAQQSGGSLHYDASGAAQQHTLFTPRGGQFRLQLPDGTKVWLNAASSITFPTAFEGNERLVQVSGEVYMEVAENVRQPFRVQVTNGPRLEVLGTSFNINAYADEPIQRTTLVQGSIRYISGTTSQVLKPGQQALLENGKVTFGTADVSEVLAWKNGLFHFSGASLQEVMRELSRWYDVDVAYEGLVRPRSFEGKIGRDLSLQDVLSNLGKNSVHYKIEGGKVIVLP